MKKLILILTIALLPFLGNAQTSILNQFENDNDVTSIVVTKKVFDMMGRIKVDDAEANQMVELVKGLKEMKLYTTFNTNKANEMKSAIDTYLKQSKLSELLRVNDKDAKVNIYVKEGRNDNHVTELLMFVNELKGHGGDRDPKAVILSITGDIELDKISDLINQMNVSGGEHFKNKK